MALQRDHGGEHTDHQRRAAQFLGKAGAGRFDARDAHEGAGEEAHLPTTMIAAKLRWVEPRAA